MILVKGAIFKACELDSMLLEISIIYLKYKEKKNA